MMIRLYPTVMLYGTQITLQSFSTCSPYKIVLFSISLDVYLQISYRTEKLVQAYKQANILKLDQIHTYMQLTSEFVLKIICNFLPNSFIDSFSIVSSIKTYNYIPKFYKLQIRYHIINIDKKFIFSIFDWLIDSNSFLFQNTLNINVENPFCQFAGYKFSEMGSCLQNVIKVSIYLALFISSVLNNFICSQQPISTKLCLQALKVQIYTIQNFWQV